VLGLLCLPAAAASQETEPLLRLEEPPPLVAGQRATLVAVVELGPELPLLLTPHTEGTALASVRGRLLRGDAFDETARPLRFPIPVVARAAGTAILRVQLTSFRCDEANECVPVEAEASLTLRIQPTAP